MNVMDLVVFGIGSTIIMMVFMAKTDVEKVRVRVKTKTKK
jgi:hypothetical protein